MHCLSLNRWPRSCCDFIPTYNAPTTRAERTAANGGVIPSNIGLDGTIGGEADGKWWGGTYGWGFNCVVPQTGERVWRSAFGTHAAMGFGNAILLTGDVERYASVWRGVLDTVNANTKEGEDGQLLYPHVYGAFPGDHPKVRTGKLQHSHSGITAPCCVERVGLGAVMSQVYTPQQ